jgi:threonyl-tRNA synthetase
MKVHTMFVIAKRDMAANAVSVRVHGKGNLGANPRGEAIVDILLSMNERRASPACQLPPFTQDKAAETECQP